MSRQCVIVFGGSFDPVHKAHVAIAEHICSLFDADKLILLPTGNPWQKDTLNTPASHRIRMLELAFANSKLNWTIDDRETRSKSPSYSVVTLQSLRKSIGKDVSLVFLIGADQLISLNTWYNWHMLFELVHLVVMARPGFTTTLTQALPPLVADAFIPRIATVQTLHETALGHTLFCEDIQLSVSSSAIREMLRCGQTTQSLIEPKILDYIKENNLYQAYGN